MSIGSWIWIDQTKQISGPKWDTACLVKRKILQRVGSFTYRVQRKPSHAQEVHLDEMEPYVAATITGVIAEAYPHKRGMVHMVLEPGGMVLHNMNSSDSGRSPLAFLFCFSARRVWYCQIKVLYQEMKIILRPPFRGEAWDEPGDRFSAVS